MRQMVGEVESVVFGGYLGTMYALHLACVAISSFDFTQIVILERMTC